MTESPDALARRAGNQSGHREMHALFGRCFFFPLCLLALDSGKILVVSNGVPFCKTHSGSANFVDTTNPKGKHRQREK